MRYGLSAEGGPIGDVVGAKVASAREDSSDYGLRRGA